MSQDTSVADLNNVNLQDVSGGSLRDVVDRQAHKTEKFMCEYGARDDGTMVYHFFSPLNEDWDPAYKMDKRLSAAIHEKLSNTKYNASFVEEFDSFCVLVFNAMLAPDPFSLCHQFFAAIESADVSGTSEGS